MGVYRTLFVIFIAEYLSFFLLLAVPFFWFRGRRLWAFKTVVAMAAAFALSELIKHYFYTPRPFVAQNFPPLISHEADGSFPSSHASFLAALSASVFFLDWRLGVFLLLGTILVGFGRVAAGVHFWTDILGGIVLGFFVAPLVHRIETYFIKKY